MTSKNEQNQEEQNKARICRDTNEVPISNKKQLQKIRYKTVKKTKKTKKNKKKQNHK